MIVGAAVSEARQPAFQPRPPRLVPRTRTPQSPGSAERSTLRLPRRGRDTGKPSFLPPNKAFEPFAALTRTACCAGGRSTLRWAGPAA
jgi:hypothetical protein